MKLGAFGEAYAAGHLLRQGYEIVQRNYRCRGGEIDIVAREGTDLVFVEVKCRRSSRFGTPEDSITRARYARLEGAIQHYLGDMPVPAESYRLDVVALEVDHRGAVTRCNVLRGVGPPER